VKCEKDATGARLYTARSVGQDIDCLSTGIVRDPDSGAEVYRWAILCGPITSGGVPEENRALGEHDCFAVRQGPTIAATRSDPVPCQYIQLGECGCAPDDVYDYGLGRPVKPCETPEDCPYLCGDATDKSAVKKLCDAFPGGIEWWEGRNFLNFSIFDDSNPSQMADINIEILNEQPPVDDSSI